MSDVVVTGTGGIADAVAWLTGPDAGCTTGTDLLVDGGVAASLWGWSSSG